MVVELIIDGGELRVIKLGLDKYFGELKRYGVRGKFWEVDVEGVLVGWVVDLR